LTEIRSHTGLRGLAALLVVAYHLQYSANHLAIEDATSFFRRSYLMVDLFFILSGFIIFYVHDARNEETLGRREAMYFFAKRLIRIYPLHLLILLLMLGYRLSLAALFLANGRVPPTDWSAASLTMLTAQFLLVNAWMPPPNGWNIPSWSISAEFVAYALFPLFILIEARTPRLFAAVAVASILLFYTHSPVDGSLDITGGVGAPARCLAGFTLGLLIYRYREIIDFLHVHSLSVMQMGCLFLAVFVMTAKVHDSFVIPAFALIIVSTWRDSGILAKIMGGPTMRKLGEISFSIYISHILIIGMIGFAWERSVRKLIPNTIFERVAFITVCYAAVIGLSFFIYRRFERPVREYLTARLNARRGRTIGSLKA
jgi:peptidoglycan/LPS O-acetylase OafA/YrhL